MADDVSAPAPARPQMDIPLDLSAAAQPAGLAVLDQRLRGTRFVALASRSVLNAPSQTGVNFWSRYKDRLPVLQGELAFETEQGAGSSTSR